MNTFEPRRIESVADVEAVLGSARASFIELMECVAVAKVAGRWDLRRSAAERAFDEVDARSAAAPGSLPEAADTVVACCLAGANDLVQLPPRINEADGWLTERESRLRAAKLDTYYDEKRQALAELQVLLADDGPSTLIRLSSKLRRLGHPLLAVSSAERALEAEPDSAAAFTTLGAGLCDLKDYGGAEVALRRALEVSPGDVQASVALSRVLQESGRTDKAFDLARVAFQGREDSYTAHRLLAAAAARKDEESVELALAAIENSNMTRDEKDDPHLLLLAAEIQLESGRAETAAQLVGRVSSEMTSGEVARRLVSLKRKLNAPIQPTLLDESDARAKD